MIVFLAGGVAGNLNPLWKMIARGTEERKAIESFLGRGRESKLDSLPDG